MTTVTMNISLTEDLKSFVDGRIKARGYSSTSEYVRDLVRRDEERAKEERFKALIQEGLDSPVGLRSWEEISIAWSDRVAAARDSSVRKSA